jgi:putative endonuclease
MASHNQLGKEAETLGMQYLTSLGYTILHQNWRYSHYEIDIIATKEKLLHIIEVKALQSSQHGFPEDAVTKKKFRFLLNAADEFLFQHPEYRHVQYDILSVILPKNKEPEFFLLEDVYL